MIKPRKNKLCLTFVLLLSIVVFCLSIKSEVLISNIWIEAESAIKLSQPLEIIQAEETSSGKAIVSSGRSHQSDGYALYKINITHPGNYIFWARSYWTGGCSGSYLVQIDQSNRLLFGNDAVQDKWHWVKGPSFELCRGKHELILWNEEFDARLDKMLLTTNLNYMPVGYGEESNYFFDFETGLPANFVPDNPEEWSIEQETKLTNKKDWLFTEKDFKNFNSTLVRLNYAWAFNRDEFFLYNEVLAQLSQKTIYKVRAYKDLTIPDKSLRKAVVDGFNRLLTGGCIYDDVHFKDISLNEDFINTYKAGELTAKEIVKFNRMIIEKSLFQEFEQSINTAFYVASTHATENQYAILQVSNPPDFIFNTNIKSGTANIEDRNVKLLFNYIDKANYYFADLSEKRAELVLLQNGQKKKLASVEVDNLLSPDFYNQITVIRRAPEITLKHNGKTVSTICDTTFVGGNVGMGSANGDIYFDNIENITVLSPEFQHNFYEIPLNEKQRWSEISGFWTVEIHNTKSLVGRSGGDGCALFTIGENFWRDYRIEMAIKPSGKKEIGVGFYFQDEKNYYLFKWSSNQNKNEGFKQLVRIENGIETMLYKQDGGFQSDVWYKISINLLNGKMVGYIDETEVFNVEDHAFVDGKIAFRTNSQKDQRFDDILIAPTDSLAVKKRRDFSYNFEIRERAAIDLCDWMPLSEFFVGVPAPALWGDIVFVKNLFEDVFLENKRIFRKAIRLNLQIESQFADDCNPIKKDIDVVLSLKSYASGEPNEYAFIVKSDVASLFKMGGMVAEGEISTNRQQIAVTYANNFLNLAVDEKSVLQFNDDSPLNAFKVGVGFCGVGANRIRMMIDITSGEAAEKELFTQSILAKR